MIWQLLFVFFCACTSMHTSYWSYDAIDNISHKITHKSPDTFAGLNLEILFTKDANYAYLQLPSGKIRKKDKEIAISLSFDEYILEGTGYVFSGGQKISLSEELKEMLLNALINGQDVSVSVGGYKDTFLAAPFSDCYDEVLGKKRFSLKKLFSLPKLPQ